MSTLNDLIGDDGHGPRPDHPDFWRISEICMELRAEMAEANTEKEMEVVWRKRVEEVGDYDSLNYHAIQTAIQIMGIQTGAEFKLVKSSPIGRGTFVQIVQAFYDGLIIGSMYEKRGGHQDVGTK